MFLVQKGCEDHCQLLALKELLTACFYAWILNLSCRLGCRLRVDDVLSFASRTRSLNFMIDCTALLLFVQVCYHSIPESHPKQTQWLTLPTPNDKQLSGHVHFGSCLNFLLFWTVPRVYSTSLSQEKVFVFQHESQPFSLVRQLRIKSECLYNSFHRHNSVAALFVI